VPGAPVTTNVGKNRISCEPVVPLAGGGVTIENPLTLTTRMLEPGVSVTPYEML
jgi:hypothetical protein